MMRVATCLIFTVLYLYSHAIHAQSEASSSAWYVLVRENPSLSERATALERDLLQLLTLDQLQSYLEGAEASEIVLLTGESLDAFLIRQGTSSFDLSWYSLDGGGGFMTGGEFTLVGSVGQPDAGVMSGGDFTLEGGFLGPDPAPPVDPCTLEGTIFCDGFESANTSAWSSP